MAVRNITKINFLHWVSIQSPYPCRDFTNQDYFLQFCEEDIQFEKTKKIMTPDGYRLIIIYRPNLNPLILFDPLEINRKFASNGMFDYCEQLNDPLTLDDLESKNQIRVPGHIVFDTLYSLPQDKIIQYLPTILMLLRMAIAKSFIANEQFFSDLDYFPTFVSRFKHDCFNHNRVCLASGKILSSTGLFAGKTRYDDFFRSDTPKKQNKVCKFFLELYQNCSNLTESEYYNQVKQFIVNFCKTSIARHQSNGSKLTAGYYPKIHNSNDYNLISVIENGLVNYQNRITNKQQSDLSKRYIIYRHSQIDSDWFIDIENPFQLLQLLLSQNSSSEHDRDPDGKLLYLKAIFLMKDLVKRIINESRFNKPPEVITKSKK